MSKRPEDSAAATRLLKYVKYHTTSDEESDSTPSSARQFALAEALRDEMIALGVSNARLTEFCCVYGEIPASAGCESAPALGFIAHMDTSPDASGENVRPQIHPDYDGGDVPLGNGLTLTVGDFPHLAALKGRTLITTDGTTLLGADDKAGVAEIMTLAERVLKENIPHGKLCIGFTPDEEVGRGPDNFDVAGFGADFAYTVDGDAENCIEFENFNAAAAKVEFTGKSVHPGSAKGVMVNAALLAAEFDSLLPKGQTPADTEGYEGFWHLTDINGDVSSAELHYIIRDHDADSFASRIAKLEEITADMNARYGGRVKLTVREQYRNMREKIEPCMHLVENAEAAIAAQGMTPLRKPIRGGTDGARLSFMGLPCPNLGTGGHAFHGPFEHITIEGMDAATETLVGIVELYAKM
ncbi:MAG: peptidase T [Clostridia bacterium]|nr:peptidase T [Clostridia bacterium]